MNIVEKTYLHVSHKNTISRNLFRVDDREQMMALVNWINSWQGEGFEIFSITEDQIQRELRPDGQKDSALPDLRDKANAHDFYLPKKIG